MKIIAESHVPKHPGYFHLAYLAASVDNVGVGLISIGTGVGFMAATFLLMGVLRRHVEFQSELFVRVMTGLLFAILASYFGLNWVLENTPLRDMPGEGVIGLITIFILISLFFLSIILRRLPRETAIEPELSVGDMYRDGVGVAKDFQEAVRWYQTAAEAGDIAAQAALASLYREGRGVEKNPVLAYKWYVLSGFSGALKALENTLTPMEIAEGKRLAAEWQAGVDKGRSPSQPRSDRD